MMKGSYRIHIVYSLSIPTYSLILVPTRRQPQFCFLRLVDCFFRSHLILYARVPRFLCSVAFLTVSTFLIVVSSLICSHLLCRTSSLHLCVSVHFKNRRDSLLSSAHRKNLPFPVSPFASFSFQISSRKHAVGLLSFIVQHDVYASLPQKCFKSPYIDNIFFSLI